MRRIRDDDRSRSIPLECATVADIRVEALTGGAGDRFEVSGKAAISAHTPEWWKANETDPGAAQVDDAFVFTNGAPDGETEGLLLPAVQSVRADPVAVEDDKAEIDAFSRSVAEEETSGLLLPAVQMAYEDEDKGAAKGDCHEEWASVLTGLSGAAEAEPIGAAHIEDWVMLG